MLTHEIPVHLFILFYCYSVSHWMTNLLIYSCFCWSVVRLLRFSLFALPVIDLCWAEGQGFLWGCLQRIESLSDKVGAILNFVSQSDLKHGWYWSELLIVGRLAFFIFWSTYSFVRCFNFADRMVGNWYLTEAWSYSSLMTGKQEHVLTCLLTLWIFSFVNCLSVDLAYSLTPSFVFL